MSFMLSKLLWIVVAPANFLAWVLAAGVCLQRCAGSRWQRWGGRLTLFVAVSLMGLIIFPVDFWLIQPLEQRFPIPILPAQVDGIIVLGGMVDPSVMSVWGQPKLNHHADRLTEFVHLARHYPEARLVFSGGSGSLMDTDLAEAPVVRELLIRLGIPIERVFFEDQSRNTYENVAFSQTLVHPQPGETWILITSAIHMPRAVGIFHQLGWPVLPYPVAFQSGRHATLFPSLDLSNSLFRIDEAMHEWVGLIAYHLMNRTAGWY